MKSSAKTPSEYVASVPEDRRPAIRTLRTLINKHLPKGYEEGIGYGMLSWSVPLEVYPDTYNGQPLMFAALASQKQYMSLYLVCAYSDSSVKNKLVAGFKAAGKKLDVGKSCIRFKQLEDLPLGVIADVVSVVPMKAFVERAQRAHGERKKKK